MLHTPKLFFVLSCGAVYAPAHLDHSRTPENCLTRPSQSRSLLMPIDTVLDRVVAVATAGDSETTIMALSACPVPQAASGGIWSRSRSTNDGSCASDKKTMVVVGAAVVLTGMLVFAYCHPKGKEWYVYTRYCNVV